jgi:hypothetical protein
MNKSISFGIDPAGIGTTGIVAKGFGFQYVSHAQLKADYPIEAYNYIVSWIDEQKRLSGVTEIEFVSVELNHGGDEKRREVKATRELLGMLRNKFKRLFHGHLPNHKDRERKNLKMKKYGSSHSHWIDAEEIYYAHLNEKEKKYQCEDWKWNKCQV